MCTLHFGLTNKIVKRDCLHLELFKEILHSKYPMSISSNLKIKLKFLNQAIIQVSFEMHFRLCI